MANVGSAVVDFLKASNPRFQDLGTSAWGTGQTLSFQSLPGQLGLAEAVVLRIHGTVTPTLGTGAAIWSAMHSFFTNVRLRQGGEVYKDWHPFGFELRNMLTERYRNPNVSRTMGGASPAYAANLGTALPAIAGAAALPVVWTLVIPLRWLGKLAAGMMPVGDTSNPLVIELVTPTAVYGVDPENAPIIVSGGATVAANLSVSATLIYRQALSYRPGVQIQPPVVGSTLRAAQYSVPIDQVGAEVRVPHQNFYPHTMLLSVVEDGSANAATPYGGLNTTGVSRFRITLTSDAPVIDNDTAEKMNTFFLGLRLLNTVDVPDGVFPFVPQYEENGLGIYIDTDAEDVRQLPNLQDWRNMATGVTLAGGTSINAAGAGLARIRTFAEYLAPVNY